MSLGCPQKIRDTQITKFEMVVGLDDLGFPQSPSNLPPWVREKGICPKWCLHIALNNFV